MPLGPREVGREPLPRPHAIDVVQGHEQVAVHALRVRPEFQRTPVTFDGCGGLTGVTGWPRSGEEDLGDVASYPGRAAFYNLH